MEWKEISANHISDKVLISRICKKYLQLNNNQNNLIKKWAKYIKRHFSKEDIQTANKHMKRCLTALINWEMQIKTTIRYHLTPIWLITIKNKQTNTQKITNDCKDAGGKRNPCTLLVEM